MEKKKFIHGYVKLINKEKKYGFIRSTDLAEKDYFVRFDDVLGNGLKQFQEVDFLPLRTEKGLRAVSVLVTADVPEIPDIKPETIELKEGYVKFFDEDKGYGFITSCDDNLTNYFAYHVNIDLNGHKTLLPGQRVKFIPIDTVKGPLALKIMIVKDIKGN